MRLAGAGAAQRAELSGRDRHRARAGGEADDTDPQGAGWRSPASSAASPSTGACERHRPSSTITATIPVEIMAVLKAARLRPISDTLGRASSPWCSRTAIPAFPTSLRDDFCTACFNDADTVVIVADVYAAGEKPISKASDRDIAGRRPGTPPRPPPRHCRSSGSCRPCRAWSPPKIKRPNDVRDLPRRREHHGVGQHALPGRSSSWAASSSADRDPSPTTPDQPHEAGLGHHAPDRSPAAACAGG